MQLEKLEYFLEVVRTGSINQAAQNLNITHQALNQAMKLMEREIGVQLFQGTHKGSFLTANGEIVKEAAETILSTYKKMQQDLFVVNNVNDTIRISCMPYFEWVFYETYAYIKRNYPNVQLHMQTLYCEDAIPQLANREIDTAFISILESDLERLLIEHPFLSYLEVKVLKNDILINKHSHLAKRTQLYWEDLKNEIIAFNNIGDSNKNHLINAVKNNGCNNLLYLHSDNVIFEAVEENLACMFINENAVIPDKTKQKTCVVDFDENLNTSLVLLYTKDRTDEKILMKIMHFIKRCCK